MRALAIVSALTLAAACSTPSAKPRGEQVIETIQETTMGDLGGVPCGMGNMGQDSYLLPDGTEKTGMTATLFPGEEGFHTVGLGSVIDVEGVKWEVIEVRKVEGELGKVTLKRQDPDQGAALDFKYDTECTQCGEVAGWTGRIETHEWGDKMLVMRCQRCDEEFQWYSGKLKAQVEAGGLDFVPGRKAV